MDDRPPLWQTGERKYWVAKAAIFLFSSALAGVIVGMLVAFANWHIGKLIVLSSLGVCAVLLLLGRAVEFVEELLELVERIFPGWKSPK
ncbi:MULTISPECIES: hypothetical protein [Rhizobium]|jgi:CHASE2 domain-containing sensor protein|uniref:CHASE2 domain-containing sensor protein n=1 Tax=Rhizobium tropici TaxID=398 RepID=A0A6P1C6I7_RHITR|nr:MULTISPECIES: hypothetical protein [Rhizobium]MBB4240330.1 CHASE2 domain-containing sensor protein [Rhizobium tropici]MBB5591600.1 CHASE2 domain-containing sensor protein [Rhizobium tropici]MBB6490316.1 CHASE2 domain-containing sensor protein [Rhizobium tropici]NEV11193.1 hypothetical protein [Rhizobium tropici]TGE99202.1 hypothetical protein C9417_09420 [Rhizobium sp. SEMIA 4088]